MAHPILSNFRYLILYCLFWLLLTFAGASMDYYNYHFSLSAAVINSGIYNFLFAVLTIGLWYTVRYSNLEKANLAKRTLHHFLEGVIISTLWLLVCFLILKGIFYNNKTYLSSLYQSIPIQFAIGIVYYALSIMFYYLLISYRDLQEKSKNEAELKALINETELNMLKSQINPHFLFNSLNSISSLTVTNPSKAQEMIIKLSEFLRNSISHKDEHLVSLRDEIQYIQLYLDIEKVRFGERLHYNFSADEKCNQFLVPSMLLQPLFENAIKHGVYESTEEVTVTFTCEPVPAGLKMKISNNFDPQAPPRKGNRMGIKNIMTRLKLLYQSDNLLKINKTENLFEVDILIPLKPAKQNPS